jgi:hypothetical protein
MAPHDEADSAAVIARLRQAINHRDLDAIADCFAPTI